METKELLSSERLFNFDGNYNLPEVYDNPEDWTNLNIGYDKETGF